MEKLTIYYHTSTHWDREWYLPFQGFRYNLVKMIDGMLETTESDRDYGVFTMDGQTIVLEDYKEISPDGAKKLQKLIDDGKLKVGPWYIMPDEFLVSGESIIRNLMKGHRVAKEWNTTAWKYGYVNDIFGHIAQLPQIFEGFDIHGAYLGRGLGNDKPMSHFLWKAPNGSECYGYLGYYGGFARDFVASKFGKEGFDKALTEYVDNEIAKSDIPIIMLLHSDDHLSFDKNIPDIKKRIKELYPDAELKHIPLDEMANEVKNYKDRLPVFTGELGKSSANPDGGLNGNLVLIANCLSSYYPLKQNNDRCQNLLEKCIEPLIAVSGFFGKELNRQYANLSYQYLLQNQPHDSICGCSVDQTHQDMLYRYAQVYEIADALKWDFFYLGYPDIERTGNEYRLDYYHFEPYAEKRVITVDIPFYGGFPKEKNSFSRNEPICCFKMLDENNNEVEYQIEKVDFNGHRRIVKQWGEHIENYTVSFEASLPACGRVSYRVIPSDTNRVVYGRGLESGDNWAQNEHIRLEITDNGELNITDIKSGNTYYGLNKTVDNGETGDGWWHMPPINDRVILSSGESAVIEKISDGASSVTFTVKKELTLPAEFDDYTHTRSERTVKLPICSTVTLKKNENYVHIETVIDNIAKDHRLRLKLPTGICSDSYFTGQAFYRVDRPTALTLESQQRYEQEAAEKNMNGIIGVRNGDGSGFVFVSAEGLHEGTVNEQGDIYVTLLRAFRKVFHQPNAEKSQIQQKLTYKYALVPISAETEYSDLLRIQNALSDTDIYTCYKVDKDTSFEKSVSLITVTNKNTATSVIKKAEEGDGTVIRLFNTTDKEQNTDIVLGFDCSEAVEINLNEELLKDIDIDKCRISLTLRPWEIKTVKLK